MQITQTSNGGPAIKTAWCAGRDKMVYWCCSLNILGSQELSSLFQDLIPELILSQKHHILMGQICSGSEVMSF